jgi:hypothetical protein
VIYDDPSTHACMCCEDWDTDCESEYPCKTVINHCATCSNPWDTTCESDSSEGHNDDENNDNSLYCLPCEPVGRQWHMQGCDDTVRFDEIIRDIHDATDSDLGDIERRSAENIQHYPQTIFGQYETRNASTDDGVAVTDNHNEEHDNPNSDCREMHPDNDDSETIEIFLKAISVYIERTMNVGLEHRPDLAQIAQSAPSRSLQPQESENEDERDDIACATEAGDKQSDRSDFAESAAPGTHGSTPDVMGAKDEAKPRIPPHIDARHRTVSQISHYDRVIIEWCCGHDSMLGRPSTHSDGRKVVRFTSDDDLRTMEGLQKALRIVQDCPRGRILLWSSMPCAGGSPWQTLNIALGKGIVKIEGHWRDFRLLWSNFEIMARAVMDICGKVVIEWPGRCKYWTETQVVEFVKKHNFVQTIFHGCAYGLVTKYNLPLGQAMKKPWRSSSNDPVMLSFLKKKCQGGHDHAECRGRDGKVSEDYTPAVIDAIRAGFRLCCGPSDGDFVVRVQTLICTLQK